MNIKSFLPLFVSLVFAIVTASSDSGLYPSYYDRVCPQALPTIKRVVEDALAQERRMGASLLRLHFHDCFVNLGGPTWNVKLGRRDSTTASRTAADANLPSPFMDLPALIKNFQDQGLDEEDLVVLSGAHTLGFAQCRTFRNRTYSDTNIDPAFASHLRTICPQVGSDSSLAPLDPTPASFDVKYFTNLVSKKGLLRSDQALFNGGETDELVSEYNRNQNKFFEDFAESMIKMGDIKPLTGNRGQIRNNCRKIN
ncbi:hypothetical protein L1987_51982 [Smallanthus sonchifolius]|uniref:Uncharacterized protein n=1 Tax=Smallanthus sonchifolius TaxID=185202 RepID=A0ACB9ET15_9ASTR|nr:hypothetical protein L1987_51982 [Smallanthus sonchifolius]